MAKKLRMNGLKNRTIEEIFADFARSQSAKGLAETTIRNDSLHLHSIFTLGTNEAEQEQTKKSIIEHL